VHVAEVLLEVVHTSEASHDLLLLSLVHIDGNFLGKTKRLDTFVTMFGQLLGKLLLDADLAERSLLEHNDGEESPWAQVHHDAARVHRATC